MNSDRIKELKDFTFDFNLRLEDAYKRNEEVN
jgi:hypothetical protein